MEAVLQTLEKVGVPTLWCATLLLVWVAGRQILKVHESWLKWKKIPEQPLSKAEFEKWIKETFDVREDVCKADHKSVEVLWRFSGISTPRMEAIKQNAVVERVVERVVELKSVPYSEQVTEVERPRFHTGENPVFAPSTQKPPPRGFEGPRKNYAFNPDERDSTPVPDSLPDTPVDHPKRRK